MTYDGRSEKAQRVCEMRERLFVPQGCARLGFNLDEVGWN